MRTWRLAQGYDEMASRFHCVLAIVNVTLSSFTMLFERQPNMSHATWGEDPQNRHLMVSGVFALISLENKRLTRFLRMAWSRANLGYATLLFFPIHIPIDFFNSYQRIYKAKATLLLR